jgi:segregation and condensation protein B
MKDLETNPEAHGPEPEEASTQKNVRPEAVAGGPDATPPETGTAEPQAQPEPPAAESEAETAAVETTSSGPEVPVEAGVPAGAESETPAAETQAETAAPGATSAETESNPQEAEEPTGPTRANSEAISMEELLSPDAQATESGAQAIPVEDVQLKAVLEAIVYVAEEPLSLVQIASALQQPAARVQSLLNQLMEEFEKPEHGVSIREVAGGFKMATKPEHHEAVRSFVKSLKPPLKLSLPALETLAVIAYKQPVTGPEIAEIRGVQGTGVLKTLLDRKLIAHAGRKNVIGKPILFKTTKEFLIQFGLKDLSELPTLKEFEEIRRMALSDDEPAPVAAEAAEGQPAEGNAAESPAAEAAPEPQSVPTPPGEES